ncbi:MAG: TetR/AcrR family transcriptional regulator [Campylobacterales bacterium]|nr:TetR/AcrR family transcriptional regulator [Campylobacterales bacterium]
MEIATNLTPKGMARYKKLLEVAGEVFLEEGFEKAGMNQIIQRSGGSLSTVYKIFGNKEGLFGAMLEYKMELIFEGIEQKIALHEEGLQGFLMAVGGEFLDLVSTDDAVLFHRLIISEGYRDNAKLGKLFVDHAGDKIARLITSRLEVAKEEGKIHVEDTLLAAHQFLHALKDPFLFRRVLGITIDISPEAKMRALTQLVKIFCKGL